MRARENISEGLVEFPGARVLFIRDPDENLIELHQLVASRGGSGNRERVLLRTEGLPGEQVFEQTLQGGQLRVYRDAKGHEGPCRRVDPFPPTWLAFVAHSPVYPTD